MHYQSGLWLDLQHGELKKQYFELKALLRKTKTLCVSHYVCLIYLTCYEPLLNRQIKTNVNITNNLIPYYFSTDNGIDVQTYEESLNSYIVSRRSL